ncbi:hypothetical protein ACOME3_008121 [Neoechinorhynchus agilis]
MSNTPNRGRVAKSFLCNERKKSISIEENEYWGFDWVYSIGSFQDKIYKDQVAPNLNELLNGRSMTYLAYGQTGSGKTYTMIGQVGRKPSGLIYLSILNLLKLLKKQSKKSISIYASCLEQVGSSLKDLFADDRNPKKLIQIHNHFEMPFATNTTALKINNVNDCLNYLNRIMEKRCTRSNSKNLVSSRSHCWFSVHISKRNEDQGERFLFDFTSASKFQSRLAFLDLAGSEKCDNSQLIDYIKETSAINCGLYNLRRSLLSCVKTHGPPKGYTTDYMQQWLNDTFTGHTKTTMIFCITAYEEDLRESMSTLDFGCMAGQIRFTKLKLKKQVVDAYSLMQKNGGKMSKKKKFYAIYNQIKSVYSKRIREKEDYDFTQNVSEQNENNSKSLSEDGSFIEHQTSDDNCSGIESDMSSFIQESEDVFSETESESYGKESISSEDDGDVQIPLPNISESEKTTSEMMEDDSSYLDVDTTAFDDVIDTSDDISESIEHTNMYNDDDFHLDANGELIDQNCHEISSKDSLKSQLSTEIYRLKIDETLVPPNTDLNAGSEYKCSQAAEISCNCQSDKLITHENKEMSELIPVQDGLSSVDRQCEYSKNTNTDVNLESIISDLEMLMHDRIYKSRVAAHARSKSAKIFQLMWTIKTTNIFLNAVLATTRLKMTNPTGAVLKV